jgi:hypothetical protein
MTDSREPSVVASTLMMRTCLVLGLLAGGMLVIGASFVSFWKSLPSGDFQAWFASHSHLIGRLMIPLGSGAVAVTVAAIVACWRGPAGRRRWLLNAAFSVVGVMITYPIFFRVGERGVRAWGPFRFGRPRLARSVDGLALVSNGTRDVRVLRGLTSAS